MLCAVIVLCVFQDTEGSQRLEVVQTLRETEKFYVEMLGHLTQVYKCESFADNRIIKIQSFLFSEQTLKKKR